MSILNSPVSWFNKYHDPVPAGKTTILEWLQNDTWKNEVEAVRKITDKGTRDKLKSSLPAITVSGTFSTRSNQSLIQHSGFICLDIDLQANKHIGNYAQLKTQISNISQAAYCGWSVSRTGYFVLIPLAFPEKHLQHFFALKKIFSSFGINIDNSCKDLARLRGYSWNDDDYFNHTAIPFKTCYQPPIQKSTNVQSSSFQTSIQSWQQYNQSNHYEDILIKHGWQILCSKSDETYYTRPGKTTGISAGFNHKLKTFYVFTSATNFEPNKAYTPFAIYAILEHNSDFKKASVSLKHTV